MGSINFLTPNIVVVCYPPFAGGKFLISSLGLSDSCVLQHRLLAGLQITTGFGVEEKFKYIKEKLHQARQNKLWTDLDLGCGQLFGDGFIDTSPRINIELLDPVIEKLSHSDKIFFAVAHSADVLLEYLRVWPNARIILFKNFEKLINARKNGTTLHANSYRPSDSDMEGVVSGFDSTRVFYWDVNSYDTLPEYINQLDVCTNWLEINPIDHSYVNKYYHSWRDTLDYLKHNK